MVDFLKNNYFLIIYAVALIVSIVRYRRYFDTVLKYFPIIIAYTFLSEVLGFLIRDYEGFQIAYIETYSYSNNLIFNIFDVIFFLYFYHVFWKVIVNRGYRKFIQFGALLFVVVSIINPFFQNPIVFPQTYAITVGSFVLIVAVLLYFRELESRKEKTANSRNLLLWIGSGLLVFYSFYPLLMSNWLWSRVSYEYYYIGEFHHLLIALMYTAFIIGFIRMGKRLRI